MTHVARNAEAPTWRDGRHWATGPEAVQHPGRLADCALCILSEALEADTAV